jgi:hypothetical protein
MRRFLLPLVAAALFVTGLGLGATGASVEKLSATLASGSEVPAPKGAARGAGRFTATLSGRSLAWRLTFSRLTGRALAAHIHLAKPGVAGPVAVPLCGPCVSGANRKVTVSAKVRAALLARGAYVNVHTAKNPAGEIRGQVARGSASAPAAPGTTTTTPTTTTDDDGGYGGYGG